MTKTAIKTGTLAMIAITPTVEMTPVPKMVTKTLSHVSETIPAIDTIIKIFHHPTAADLKIDTLIKVRRSIKLTGLSHHPLTAQNHPPIMLKTGKAGLLTKITTVAQGPIVPAQ
jgi:hypothetical protein